MQEGIDVGKLSKVVVWNVEGRLTSITDALSNIVLECMLHACTYSLYDVPQKARRGNRLHALVSHSSEMSHNCHIHISFRSRESR